MMENVKYVLFIAITAIACPNMIVYADTPDQDALEAELKYRKAERIYQKRLDEKERARVVKQREMKNEQDKHQDEVAPEERTHHEERTPE